MVPATGLLSRLLSTSTTFELSLWPAYMIRIVTLIAFLKTPNSCSATRISIMMQLLPKTPADFHLKYSLQLDLEVLVI